MKKVSDSYPQDVKIILSGPGIRKEYGYKEADKDILIDFPMRGRQLDEGPNDISVSLSYKDKNRREFNDSESMPISLVDVNLFQRIFLVFDKMIRRLTV